jgi:hypothetical protein
VAQPQQDCRDYGSQTLVASFSDETNNLQVFLGNQNGPIISECPVITPLVSVTPPTPPISTPRDIIIPQDPNFLGVERVVQGPNQNPLPMLQSSGLDTQKISHPEFEIKELQQKVKKLEHQVFQLEETLKGWLEIVGDSQTLKGVISQVAELQRALYGQGTHSTQVVGSQGTTTSSSSPTAPATTASLGPTPPVTIMPENQGAPLVISGFGDHYAYPPSSSIPTANCGQVTIAPVGTGEIVNQNPIPVTHPLLQHLFKNLTPLNFQGDHKIGTNFQRISNNFWRKPGLESHSRMKSNLGF